MKPTIGTFVATAGRETLRQTLESIQSQRLIPGDDVLIVTDGVVPWVEEHVAALGAPFRLIVGPQTGDWGHTQQNIALEQVRGDLVVGQDDDDVFTPRAFDTIREVATEAPDRLMMFRFRTPKHATLWERPAWDTLLDGHCLVIPNDKSRMGRFGTPHHHGDQDWIQSTARNWNLEALWVRRLIGIGRPSAPIRGTLVQTSDDVERLRVIRNGCAEFMTHHRGQITAARQREWWATAEHDNLWCYLYRTADNAAVGYSHLRRTEGRIYASYGLVSEARGKGYGHPMIEHALIAAQGPVYGDLLESNERVWHVDQKLGWREVSREGGIIKVRHPGIYE